MTANLRLVDAALRSGDVDRPRAGALLGAAVSFHGDTSDPITALAAQDLRAHLDENGSRPDATAEAGQSLMRTIAAVELTGRGGGHFPVVEKWRSQLRNGGGGVVIANGAEGEPASGKDAALLQLRPHLVLDGLASAAEVVDADEAVIWLHEGALRSRQVLALAILARRTAGLTEVPMRIALGPDRYLSGESSAIIRSLNGGPALPQFRTVPATRSGVNGQPSLVHNVETLARVARLVRSDSSDYPDTTLLTVAPAGRRTVVEVDPASSLTDVVTTVLGADPRRPPQAVLVGGYGGSWIGWEDLVGLPASENGLREKGFSLGCGVLIPVAQHECGLLQASLIADYLAESSARQCGPCLFGLRTVADGLAQLVTGDTRRRDVSRLQRFLREIVGRGACHHPDGAVRMICSALSTFAVDVDSHLRHGRCAQPGRGLPTPPRMSGR